MTGQYPYACAALSGLMLLTTSAWADSIDEQAEQELRIAHKFQEVYNYRKSLTHCVSAWSLGSEGGLTCAAHAAFYLGRFEVSLDYAQLAIEVLSERPESDERTRLLETARKQTKGVRSMLRRLRDAERNRPEINFVRRLGDRWQVRVRNRAGEPLRLDTLESTALDRVDVAYGVDWDGSSESVPAHGSLTGEIWIDDVQHLEGADFAIHGFAGVPVKTVFPAGIMTWKGPPDPRWKHLTLSVKGMYGGYWVPGTQQNPRNPIITDTSGLALRLGKGFSEYLAIDVELAGGSTGTAEFDPGMTRSGQYGRVVVQGVARFGTEWVGSLRLGTGIQVARYESESPDMEGTDIDPLYAFGFGLDRRLANFHVGMYGDFIAATGSGARALSLGLQFGYGWSL